MDDDPVRGCERSLPETLASPAVIEESQLTERIEGALSARHQLGRETLAGLILKVREDLLAVGTGEAGGGALDRDPHRESGFGIPDP